MTHRFYIPSENINLKQNTAVLAGEEWQHASKVLRFKDGEPLEFFDGQGNVFYSVISGRKDKIFSLEISKSVHFKKDYRLAVFIGLPKGSKADSIINALTQAGASAIGMFTSKYSEVRAKSAKKIERLRKISIEACKQSQRAWLPAIDINLSFDELCERVGAGLKPAPTKKSVVFYEQASSYQPFSYFQSKDLALVIGPEGGFAGSEVDCLKAKGVATSRLGDAILRVETAAIAATSLARYAQLVAR